MRRAFTLGELLVLIAIVAVIGALIVAGISGRMDDTNRHGTLIQEAKQTESNQERLRQAHPLPKLDHSLELANLIKRLERINRSNRVAYVYCLSSDGHVVASWVINGKISSLNSLLTTPEQPVTITAVAAPNVTLAMPSPDFDGSYGRNPEGSFFFDVRDQMTEIVLAGGIIICTETPMHINTPISLTVVHDPEKPARPAGESATPTPPAP
jgi:type II secretory pathway pseudopilin PulG